MPDLESRLQQWIDDGALEDVKREILDIADDERRRTVLERLFVSDLNHAGAAPRRGFKLISLQLHALLLPDAIGRISSAASTCLSSSALEAGIARDFAKALHG